MSGPGRLSVASVGSRPAFKPYVWLGDNDRGCAWFCESADMWLPEDREDAITVDREDDRVVLTLHLIAGEKIAERLKYTFGFQATPIKQPEKTVWDYRIMHGARYGMQDSPATAAGRLEYPAAGKVQLQPRDLVVKQNNAVRLRSGCPMRMTVGTFSNGLRFAQKA